jgi:hypothetical protein
VSEPPYLGPVAAGVVVALVVGIVVCVVNGVMVGVVDGLVIGVVVAVGWPHEVRSSKITTTQLVTRKTILAFIFPPFPISILFFVYYLQLATLDIVGAKGLMIS